LGSCSISQKFTSDLESPGGVGSSASVIVIAILLSDSKVTKFEFAAIGESTNSVTIKFKTQRHCCFAGSHNFD
jgi:hypothetical protein